MSRGTPSTARSTGRAPRRPCGSSNGTPCPSTVGSTPTPSGCARRGPRRSPRPGCPPISLRSRRAYGSGSRPAATLGRRWPEVDARVAELEQRQAAVAAELRELHERLRLAPECDHDRLAEWELADRDGPPPEAELPAIEDAIERVQAEREGRVRPSGCLTTGPLCREAPPPARQRGRCPHRRGPPPLPRPDRPPSGRTRQAVRPPSRRRLGPPLPGE